MARRIVMLLLALGAIAGFGSAAVQAAHGGGHGWAPGERCPHDTPTGEQAP